MIINRKVFQFCAGLLLFVVLPNRLQGQLLPLSTSSEESVKLYRQGWDEIMNNGNYSYAEELYRETVSKDPDFLIGLSLVARISRDEEEREKIFLKLKNERHLVTGPERQLLDVYIGLVELTNARGEGLDSLSMNNLRNRVFRTASENLKVITDNYPDEVYYLSEYIEVLDYLFGAIEALKFFESITPMKIKKTPFIWGFAAELYSQEGSQDLAYQMVKELETMLPHDVPKPWVTWGRLYYDQGLLQEALFFTDRALMYDEGNIDAQRLKATLLEKI